MVLGGRSSGNLINTRFFCCPKPLKPYKYNGFGVGEVRGGVGGRAGKGGPRFFNFLNSFNSFDFFKFFYWLCKVLCLLDSENLIDKMVLVIRNH